MIISRHTAAAAFQRRRPDHIYFLYILYINIYLYSSQSDHQQVTKEKTHVSCPPQASLDLFRAPKLIFWRKKYARCGYTNVICISLAITFQKHLNTFSKFTLFKNPYFQKWDIQKTRNYILICMALYIFYKIQQILLFGDI